MNFKKIFALSATGVLLLQFTQAGEQQTSTNKDRCALYLRATSRLTDNPSEAKLLAQQLEYFMDLHTSNGAFMEGLTVTAANLDKDIAAKIQLEASIRQRKFLAAKLVATQVIGNLTDDEPDPDGFTLEAIAAIQNLSFRSRALQYQLFRERHFLRTGKDLTVNEKKAIDQAHFIEFSHISVGADGENPNGLLNYSSEYLHAKETLLTSAGFSRQEVRELMDSGVTGLLSAFFKFLTAIGLRADAKGDEAIMNAEASVSEEVQQHRAQKIAEASIAEMEVALTQGNLMLAEIGAEIRLLDQEIKKQKTSAAEALAGAEILKPEIEAGTADEAKQALFARYAQQIDSAENLVKDKEGALQKYKSAQADRKAEIQAYDIEITRRKAVTKDKAEAAKLGLMQQRIAKAFGTQFSPNSAGAQWEKSVASMDRRAAVGAEMMDIVGNSESGKEAKMKVVERQVMAQTAGKRLLDRLNSKAAPAAAAPVATPAPASPAPAAPASGQQ